VVDALRVQPLERRRAGLLAEATVEGALGRAGVLRELRDGERLVERSSA
jgi:hypothetical protein